jgi:hypothetical protein
MLANAAAVALFAAASLPAVLTDAGQTATNIWLPSPSLLLFLGRTHSGSGQPSLCIALDSDAGRLLNYLTRASIARALVGHVKTPRTLRGRVSQAACLLMESESCTAEGASSRRRV